MLRQYQKNIVAWIRRQIKSAHTKLLVASPTGSGKTIIAQYIADNAAQKGNKVLFTTHRQKIAEQTLEKFNDLKTSLIMGKSKRYDPDAPVQVGMIHTLYRREDIPIPDIVIMDEIHYGTNSNMIQSLFARFPDAIFIGLSATPIERDGYLLDGFDKTYQDLQTQDLISQKHLICTENYTATQIDLSDVSIHNHEYNQEQTSEKVNERTVLTNIVTEWKKHSNKRKTIAFCQDIRHSKNLCAQFQKEGVPATVVHSKLKKYETKERFRQFRDDEVSVLCSVDMITEGFDDADVGTVILARATKVLRTYIQMVGRGLRPGKYNKCIVIDAGNNFEEHGLPTDNRQYKKRPIISETADKVAREASKSNDAIPTQEKRKKIFLRQISSLLELYDDKEYSCEQEILDDVRKMLKKTDHFVYRQNSGKAYMRGRWVHFTDVTGLPDITICYNPYLDVRIELKHPKKGRKKRSQELMAKEMHEHRHLSFFAESVRDVAEIIMHIENHIRDIDGGLFISDTILQFPQRQLELFEKYDIETCLTEGNHA